MAPAVAGVSGATSRETGSKTVGVGGLFSPPRLAQASGGQDRQALSVTRANVRRRTLAPLDHSKPPLIPYSLKGRF